MLKTTLLTLCIFTSILHAQNTKKPLTDEVNTKLNLIMYENTQLHSKIDAIEKTNAELRNSIDNLKHSSESNSAQISEVKKELGLKISSTEESNSQKFKEVNDSLSTNSLYGIIGLLSAIILSGLVYWLVGRKQKSDKSDMIQKLNSTKSDIEEKLVSEFGKQTEMMEAQLQLAETQKQNVSASQPKEIDHSLALRVADEITLIERNISLMDPGVKGLKQLTRSVEKLKDNLNANGYEIPELLGKNYHQGMKAIITSSIPDENLEKDVEIISKIVKPQVNFDGIMIQAAQIEVSVGY